MKDDKNQIKIITPTPVQDGDDEKKNKIHHEDYNSREMYAIQDRKINPVTLIVMLLILAGIILIIIFVTVPLLDQLKPEEAFILLRNLQ